MRLFLVLLSLGFAPALAWSETFQLERTDGSSLTYYLEAPSQNSFPLLVVLQGSTCETGYPLMQRIAGSLLKQGIATLAVEKRGLHRNSSECPQEYLERNSIPDRVLDYLSVIAHLRKTQLGWNGQVVWAGGSEGGQIAALVGPLVPETVGVAFLASGGGITMAEELLLLTEKKMRAEGAAPAEIDLALDQLLRKFEEIRSNPTYRLEWLSDEKTARNTYQWWNSILFIKALPVLERVDFPIYMAHGTRDTSCPVESSDLVAARFQELGKSNLTYKRYPGLEHDWKDEEGRPHPEVLTDVLAWIVATLKKANALPAAIQVN